MTTREDKLKNLLGGVKDSTPTKGPQEVNINSGISPVAKIKVV
jgi:hypothetical protein